MSLRMTESHRFKHIFPGVPLALVSAALFGATAPLSKILLGSVSPLLLAGLLYLGAGVGLSIFVAFRGIGTIATSEAPLRGKDIPWLLGAIGAGGVVGPVLLMFGLSITSASNTALLLNLEGVATLAIAWVVFRENVDRRLLLGAASILAGAVLLSWGGQGFRLDKGAMLVAGACIAWGIDNNLTRKISGADPVVITTLKGLVAGSVNFTLALLYGAALPPFSITLAAGIVGFFGVGIRLVMFILALRHLGTARTGAYFALAPFIGAILAVGLLAEPVTLRLALAALLMGIGLWFHLAERHDHEHWHEALEHEHSHVHDEHHQHAHDEPINGPHSHWHVHEPVGHKHAHYPDLHHRHRH